MNDFDILLKEMELLFGENFNLPQQSSNVF